MGTSDGEWSERDELILRAAARVRRGLHRDPFSGLLVFRGDRFAEAIDATLTEFVPAGVPLSVVVADLDHFKRINDTHGHAVGDEVLAATGAALRDLVRPLDMVLARGGDSYLLVLLGAGLEVAQSRAEQARDLLTQVTVRGARWTSPRRSAWPPTTGPRRQRRSWSGSLPPSTGPRVSAGRRGGDDEGRRHVGRAGSA